MEDRCGVLQPGRRDFSNGMVEEAGEPLAIRLAENSLQTPRRLTVTLSVQVASGQKPVEDLPKRVNVGSLGHIFSASRRKFRRHVVQRADRLFGQRETLPVDDQTEAEVSNHGTPVVGDENVRWLEIAVDDALGMRERDRLQQGLVERKPRVESP